MSAIFFVKCMKRQNFFPIGKFFIEKPSSRAGSIRGRRASPLWSK